LERKRALLKELGKERFFENLPSQQRELVELSGSESVFRLTRLSSNRPKKPAYIPSAIVIFKAFGDFGSKEFFFLV